MFNIQLNQSIQYKPVEFLSDWPFDWIGLDYKIKNPILLEFMDLFVQIQYKPIQANQLICIFFIYFLKKATCHFLYLTC